MKIMAANYTRYVPRERLVERVRYGTGFASGKTQGGAFYLTEYKGGEGAAIRSGDGILSILDTIVPIVGTVANVVAKGANFYKELHGGGIEPEALAEVLRAKGGERTERSSLPSDTD